PSADDLSDFAARLSEDICAILQPRWERFSKLSPRQKELELQRRYLEERALQYVHASDDEQVIFDTLVGAAKARRTTVSPYAGLYLYRSGEGTGKSMLFARTAQRLAEDSANIVLPFTVGLTPQSTSALEILKTEVYALESYVNSPHLEDGADEQDFRKRLGFFCDYLAGNGRRLYFLIDGAERLQPGEDLDKLVFLPGSGRDGVAMLLMARGKFTIPVGEKIEPSAITLRERRFALKGLEAYYGRELAEEVEFALLEKTRAGGLLHVAVLLKRLQLMNAADFAEINRRGGDSKTINAYLLELVEASPDSVDELSYQIIDIIAQAVNPDLVHRVCRLLSLSAFGLRESDLAAIIGDGFSSLDLAAMIQSWNECFLIMPDGRISFQIESVALGCFEQIADPVKEAHGIFRHLCSLDERDEYRRKYLLYYAQLACSLKNPEVLRYICGCVTEKGEELLEWAAYALWRGRFLAGSTQVIELIVWLGAKASVDAVHLPAFLDLWMILMTAARYYRTDPDYEKIVSAYLDIALYLEEAHSGRYADSVRDQVADCCRVLTEYHQNRGDYARAEEYRKRRLALLENPFAGGERDEYEALMYLTVRSMRGSGARRFSRRRCRSRTSCWGCAGTGGRRSTCPPPFCWA
ncbi:MAG: hypothetical protein Q4D39_00600, partial [Coriobacteriaceae bacterium]|nr:hypothetical protein [Coriobacteriaceae bacterium]